MASSSTKANLGQTSLIDELRPTLNEQEKSQTVAEGGPVYPFNPAPHNTQISEEPESGRARKVDSDTEQIMAKGIAAVLGPVVRDFDTRVEGALRSQTTLTSSIDRLTRELDKLLEDTPLPLVAQHAARLSGVRKRVGSLTHTLHVVQHRITNMDRLLSERVDANTSTSQSVSKPRPARGPC